MKTRRFLAALLSLAMIVTSAGFSADVYAQETQDVVVSVEPQAPDTDVPADGEETPAQVEDGVEASGQNEAGLGDADTDTDNGEAEATVPEAGVEEEMPVEGEDAPAVGNPDENAGEEGLGEEDPEAETFDSIAEDPYTENGGVLELTDIPVTSDTAILPENTTTIPAGIFDQGSDAQAVTRIDFSKCAATFTTINENAFKGSKIKSIELPAGVTVIDKGVFQNCTDLISISGTSNLTSIGENAFMDSGLTGIIIPNVTAIGDNAFRDCAGLAQVELQEAETIGQGAFRGCSKLASGMVWSEKIKDIGERAFCGCGFVNLDLSLLELAPGDTVTMGSYAFADNEKLTSIVVPKELDEIPAHAFENCKKLATFTMESFNTGDENVTEKVGAFAFANCVALKAIKLGNHIATIDNDAFRGCTALSDISLYYTGNNDGLHPIDIAESAFPERNNRANAFISSYDDTVEAYADRRGYTYKLLGAHAVQPYISGYGAISTKGNQAAEGKLVRLTVTPKAGFALKWNTLRVVKKSDGSPIATNLESFTKATQIFTFIMPGEDVKIEAEFLETKKAITGELLIRVDDSIIENKGTITIDKVGATKQLEASDTAGGRLGLWNFDFASSNPSIMTVSPMGVITGLKQGIAELSVTPTGMKAKAQKFRVEVAAPTTIRAIHFDQFLSTGADPDNPLVPQSLFDNDFTAPDEPYRNPLIPNAWVYPVGYVDQYGLGDATYYVVEYEQSTVAANAQSFKPFFIATEDADGDDGYDDTTGKYDNNLFATANWTSSDPNIVKPSVSKTYTNDVTINIPKGAKGTALIRATVPNDDPDFPTAGPAGFIVRIRDRSPRLYGKYTVNTNNPNGTELKLTTVYGTRIDHSTGLTVCTKTVNKKSGQVEYVESPDLRVDPDDTDPRSDPANDIAIYYIKANKTAKPQTYKDKLYLVGQYTDNGHYFYTPIPELQIVDTSVKPKLTYQSKINLFYNRSG
ncbi:MAG: leucine-rich repeat protein, partial [Lachnospiraceae bacterium]|nr:leucine-rich repeat protein [Lachnospiraceae bacterium]